MSRAMRLIGALLLAWCAVTAQAATATVEAVSPTQLWCDAYMMSCLYPSDQAAAQATATWYNSTFAPYFQASISCDGSGNCTQTLTYLQATYPPVIYPLHLIGTIGCPRPTVNPGVPYTYIAATGRCERPVQITCPVTDLPKPPPPFRTGNAVVDACSDALEAHGGRPGGDVCGPNLGLRPDMNQAASCIAAKITALGISYSGPSATFRTDAYQKHLWEIWTRWKDLEKIRKSDQFPLEVKQACAASQVNADVHDAMKHHKLKFAPTPDSGSHGNGSKGTATTIGNGRAIDVPSDVSDALIEKVDATTFTTIEVNGIAVLVRTVTMNIEDYLHTATVNPITPACNSSLRWGGTFKNYDAVHFQLP